MRSQAISAPWTLLRKNRISNLIPKLRRGLRTVAATDALIALNAGYRSCTLGGIDETKFPANYHWESDNPDNLDWDSIEGALRICQEYLRS